MRKIRSFYGEIEDKRVEKGERKEDASTKWTNQLSEWREEQESVAIVTSVGHSMGQSLHFAALSGFLPTAQDCVEPDNRVNASDLKK